MAAFALGPSCGLAATYRSSPTACLSTEAFQCTNSSVKMFAFSLKLRQYILDVHASPFELLQPRDSVAAMGVVYTTDLQYNINGDREVVVCGSALARSAIARAGPERLYLG